jgi:hypothetical protein
VFASLAANNLSALLPTLAPVTALLVTTTPALASSSNQQEHQSRHTHTHLRHAGSAMQTSLASNTSSYRVAAVPGAQSAPTVRSRSIPIRPREHCTKRSELPLTKLKTFFRVMFGILAMSLAVQSVTGARPPPATSLSDFAEIISGAGNVSSLSTLSQPRILTVARQW